MNLQDVERIKRWKQFHPDRYWDYMRNLGILSDGILRNGEYEGINECWKDQPCFVIACAPSLKGIDLKQLEGQHTITVNHLIEDWDKSEFHLFLDQRFLDMTSYDMKKYKGVIFQKNNTAVLKNVRRAVRFLPRATKDTLSFDIKNGLWNNCNSGIAALNLALITGANPIYLIGHDSTNIDNTNGAHYKKDYPGEKTNPNYSEYEKKKQMFYNKFIPFKDRIINVCDPEKAKLKQFKTIPFEQIKINGIKKTGKSICHIGVMPTINDMGSITRDIYNFCEGNHTYIQLSDNVKNDIPKADIYILHCFKNSYELYRDMKLDGKVISIIHSTDPCCPNIYSNKIITISEWCQRQYPESTMIYAGVKNYQYNYPIDYEKNNICRFTRNVPEKIHPESHKIICEILDKHKDVSYNLFTNNEDNKTEHERFNYKTHIKINMETERAYELSQNQIFAIANDTFIDTFSLALLEAMSAGLAIVLLNNGQDAMAEILGDAGIIVNTIEEWKEAIESLIGNTALKIKYGQMAKERAQQFSSQDMVNKYNLELK
jgi:glycosyltransferase involved in cell wall biosynthesis